MSLTQLKQTAKQWSVREANRQFSTLLSEARKSPQIVARHDKDPVYLIGEQTFELLTQNTPSFDDLLDSLHGAPDLEEALTPLKPYARRELI